MNDKSYYNNLLHDHICVVVFTKKNGEERTMRCTLQQHIINEMNLNPVGGGSVVPDHQVRCIDVDKQAWRSFNVDSVTSFKIEE